MLSLLKSSLESTCSIWTGGVTDTLIIFVVVLLVMWRICDWDRPRLNFPGPTPYPILGNLPQMAPYPHLKLTEWWRRYGPVYQIVMGSRTAIVVNGLDAIRQVYLSKGNDFSGRPDFLTFQIVQDGKGLTFGSPHAKWKTHKKLARHAVRMFTKNTNGGFEKVMQTQAAKATESIIQAGKHGSFNPVKVIQASVRELAFMIIFGARHNEQYDESFRELVTLLHEFNDLGAVGLLPDIMPWTRSLVQAFGRHAAFIKIADGITEKVNNIINDHKSDITPGKARDLTDGVLNVAAEAEQKNMFTGRLTKELFERTTEELLGGSDSTMTAAIGWMLYIFSVHPEIQSEIRRELDAVVGTDRPPAIADRCQMPYTEASILEILRWASILPMALPHCTTTATTLYGKHIPAGTLVLINMWSLGRDENVWDNPEKIDPLRFIDPDTGRVDKSKKSLYLPFGAGWRRCLGQPVAETGLFLFVTTLIQKCSIHCPDSGPSECKGSMGFAWEPSYFEIDVKPR